jgi:hypothetical protein
LSNFLQKKEKKCLLPLLWCPDTEKTCPMCPPQRFCDLCLLQTETKRRLKKGVQVLEYILKKSHENVLALSAGDVCLEEEENKSIFLLSPRQLCRAISRLAPLRRIYLLL